MTSTTAKPFRLSASKLKTYLQCPRSYFLRYVQGVEQDTRGGKYLQVGIAFDLAVQHYVSGGEVGVASVDPKIRKMLDVARKYLPAPGSCTVQHQYRVPVPGEPWLVVEGKPDLRRPGWVGDTKTTAAGGEHALTAETLAKNEQALLYSWCEFATGYEGPVGLVWTYVDKATKPEAWNVPTQLWRPEVEAWFQSVALPAAREMARLHEAYDADQAHAVLDHCDRCWVRGACDPYSGPNSYDGLDCGVDLVQLRRKQPVRAESEFQMFDLKKLQEESVDLVGQLEGSLARYAPGGTEHIAINPPPSTSQTARANVDEALRQTASAKARVAKLLADLAEVSK